MCQFHGDIVWKLPAAASHSSSGSMCFFSAALTAAALSAQQLDANTMQAVIFFMPDFKLDAAGFLSLKTIGRRPAGETMYVRLTNRLQIVFAIKDIDAYAIFMRDAAVKPLKISGKSGF